MMTDKDMRGLPCGVRVNRAGSRDSNVGGQGKMAN